MGYTPFKMRGHTLPGPNQCSPCKQSNSLKLGLDSSGVETTLTKGSKPKTSYSFSPGISKGGFKAGITMPKVHYGDAKKGTDTETSFGGRTSYEFGKGSKEQTGRNVFWGGGFRGKVSGDFDTKSGGSTKLSLGLGNKGGEYCDSNLLKCKPARKVELFGKHNFKDKSTSVGVQGKYGALSVGGSYNLKTKKPSLNIGLKLGK